MWLKINFFQLNSLNIVFFYSVRIRQLPRQLEAWSKLVPWQYVNCYILMWNVTLSIFRDEMVCLLYLQLFCDEKCLKKNRMDINHVIFFHPLPATIHLCLISSLFLWKNHYISCFIYYIKLTADRDTFL